MHGIIGPTTTTEANYRRGLQLPPGNNLFFFTFHKQRWVKYWGNILVYFVFIGAACSLPGRIPGNLPSPIKH